MLEKFKYYVILVAVFLEFVVLCWKIGYSTQRKLPIQSSWKKVYDFAQSSGKKVYTFAQSSWKKMYTFDQSSWKKVYDFVSSSWEKVYICIGLDSLNA